MLPVPIVNVLFRSTEFIPQAHGNHSGGPVKNGGHPGQAFDPNVWIKVLVAEEAIAVKVAAAPPRLAYVVVKYHHHLVLSKVGYHCLMFNLLISYINIT